MRWMKSLELVIVAVLNLVAAVGYQRVFVGRGHVLTLLGAAVIPVVLIGVAQRRRLALVHTIVLVALGWVPWVVWTAYGDTTVAGVIPTLDTLSAVGSGLVGGWSDLLGASLPTRPSPSMLAAAMTITWISAGMSAELVTRRSTFVAPIVPPILAFTATLLLAASQPRPGPMAAAAFAAVALLTILVHANRVQAPRRLGGATAAGVLAPPTSSYSTDRRLLQGIPILVVASLVAPIVAGWLPMRPGNPFDPRTVREPQVRSQVAVSPLAGFKAQLTADPPVELFEVRAPSIGDALKMPLVRLVTLDRFDGATWTSSATYQDIGGGSLPIDDLAVAGPLDEVRQTYVIADLDDRWLPAAGTPIAVDIPDPSVTVRYDPVGGGFLAATESGSLSGLRYEVTGALVPDGDHVRLGVRASDGALDPLIELVSPPPDRIAALARRVVADARSPYEQLETLDEYLTTSYGYQEAVRPGHSYGRLEEFLFEERVGYAEQFASAFAVMARTLGFPTRLVVGYRTAEGEAGGVVQIASRVTSRQAHVWAEVYLGGVGWVDFDPTAQPGAVPAPVPPEPEVLALGDDQIVEQQAEPRVVGPSPTGDDNADTTGSRGWVLAVAVAVLAVVAVVGALIGAKAWRRRSRRNQVDVALRILAAWAEVTDHLIELGIRIPASMTARELAGASAGAIGPAATARLNAMIPVVTSAIYAPELPSDQDAQEMWHHAHAFRQELFAGRGRFAELAALLNPRPLLPRR